MIILVLGCVLFAGVVGTATPASATPFWQYTTTVDTETSNDVALTDSQSRIRALQALIRRALAATLYAIQHNWQQPPNSATLFVHYPNLHPTVANADPRPSEPIPEPTAALAFGAGLLLTGLAWRKR